MELPRRIEGTAYECVIACVTMLCMYWRKEKPHLDWKMPDELNAPEWDEFYASGCKKINHHSGVQMNRIRGYLNSIKMPLTMKLAPLHGLYALEGLIKFNTPPIVLFDYYFYHKGITKNPYHAAVVMELTAENVLTVDPSAVNKNRTAYYRPDFEKAWDILEKHAIIIYPSTYRLKEIGRTAKPLESFVGVGS